MKKDTWKWWLLGALALVMAYVWYNAFQTMSPEESSAYRVRTPAATTEQEEHVRTGVAYESPKVNPFQQPVAAAKPTAQTARGKATPPKLVQPRLEPHYRLTGIIDRDSRSQAVITFRDSSVVVSVGDSLAGWQLLRTSQNSALFGHEKERDTLWLYVDE